MKNESASIVQSNDDRLAVTESKLVAWSACSSGKSWFLEKFPQGGMFDAVYSALRDDRRYQDGDWLVEKVFSQLDAKAKTEQLVSITGADKAKIVAQAKECGSKKGESFTTGNWANAATTGYRADAATTGYRANAATTGEHAVAAALGASSKAKASTGGAIVLCHRNDDGELIHVRASKVGDNDIKPDTWYSLNANGDFVEG